MPSGVYPRTSLHKQNSRKGGLNSPTKFKKGHEVISSIREKISKSNTKEEHTNAQYSRVLARKILNPQLNMIVHHKDCNPFNNNLII